MNRILTFLALLLVAGSAAQAAPLRGEALRQSVTEELLREGISLRRLGLHLTISVAGDSAHISLRDARTDAELASDTIDQLPRDAEAAVGHLTIAVSRMISDSELSRRDRAADAGREPGAPASVGYGDVDASTVRIFTVGTVDVMELGNGATSLIVAAPSAGHGTGFWHDGLILTAKHVIEDAVHVVVRLPGDGGLLPATVVYRDRDHDIAVLQTTSSEPGMRLREDGVGLTVRDGVFAVGYPLDPGRKHPQSSRGIVARQLDDGHLQLDMSLNPGNSGGPVLDEDDVVVGMVSARGNVSAGVQGIGYAVTVEHLRAAVREAKRRIADGGAREITAADEHSARVVDLLLNRQQVREVREAEDLDGRITDEDFEAQTRELAEQIADPDLLVFVAANLWNAMLILRFGEVRQLGDRTLSEAEALQMASRLEDAAVEFLRRAEQDAPDIANRSPFVGAALASRKASESWAQAGQGRRTVGVRGQLSNRVNLDGATTSWGRGLDAQLRYRGDATRRVRRFVGVGMGMASTTVPLDGGARSASHSFYSLELMVGWEAALSPNTRLEWAVGVAPSYYVSKTEATGADTMVQASDIVWGHYRVSAGISYGMLYTGVGARVVGRTIWLEPVSVGLAF